MNTKRVGQLNISNADLTWELVVNEFNSLKNYESIDSPSFFVSNNIEKLYVKFYPKSVRESTTHHMGIYLVNDNSYNVTLDYSFSLLNNKNVKVKTVRAFNCTIPAKHKWGWSDYVLKSVVYDPVSKIIKDGKLTIIWSIIGQMVIADVNKNQNELSKINEQFFTNKAYSDVTVKSKKKEFNLHKVILATRSIVFEAMFNTDMMEKEKNIVEINDIDPDVLYQFFKYLYTNKVDNFKDIAKDLFFIADKYLVYDLKYESEKIMCSNINLENALEYLKIADVHNIEILQSEVIKFIAMNLIKFGDNPKFKSLSQDSMLKIMNQHICILKSQNNK